VARREVRALLTEIAERDKATVLVTSHDVGDIERVCKRAIIIHHGTVVVDEPMKELRHRSLARKYIGVKYAEPVDLDLPGLAPVKRTATAASFVVDTRKVRLEEVLRALVERGELEDLTVEDESLEEIIAGIYGAAPGGRG
jgi:ABC-2 type transport system ATP-binding protein